jgi:uncharacterized protein involved in exopolysaccharide biosynthesis
LEAERELGLGQVWRSALARWWLPLGGIVVGAIIGLLVSLGASRQWTAVREIYLGNPLANGTALTSSPTSLALATAYIDTRYAIRHASRASGIPASRLSGNISARSIRGLAATTVGQPAPLLLLSVTGSRPGAAERAADDLARLVVSQFQPYTHQKLKIAKARLAQEQSQIGDINRRLKQALDAQAALARSAANHSLVTEYAQITATLASERSMLDSDITAFKALISQTHAVETPRILSPTRSVSPTRPSRRSSIVLGAIIGFLVGLLAAILWQPITNTLRPSADDLPPQHL